MKNGDDKLIINFEKLLRYHEKLLVKSKILSDQEKDKINLKRKIIDSVVLDAPFTDSYQMIKTIIIGGGFKEWMAKTILYFFESSIKSACSYDVIGNNVPLKKVSLIQTPVVFLLGD